MPLSPADLFTSSSTQQLPLGTKGESKDGRIFRYCKADSTALVAGKLQQHEAEVANHQNMAVGTAAAVGATTVQFTLGATAATANEYAEGYLSVNDANGEGFTYKIKSHPAADSAASLTVTLEDPIREALTTSSEVSLCNNPFKNVIVNPTTATGAAIGVAVHDLTASQYGWIQTRGPVAILNEAGTAVGLGVASGTSVAGACKTAAATAPSIGIAMETLVDTEYSMVYLQID